MAQGDTLEVTERDEIEITFQFNMKKALVQKRRDADQLTHVMISFAAKGFTDPARAADVKFEPLSAGADGDGTKAEVLPITKDDESFTRLYRVGFIKNLDENLAPPDTLDMRVFAHLIPKDPPNTASVLPRNAELGVIRVNRLRKAGA